MKEKRYLSDKIDGISRHLTIVNTLISLIVVTTVVAFIDYKYNMNKYGYELYSYSPYTYEHLDKIADNVIIKDYGINFTALPDDVVDYEVTTENDEITFIYTLNNNSNMKYASNAEMTVKLAKDFSIISKTPNYSSEEEYINYIKTAIKVCAFMAGLFCWLIFKIVF